MIDAAQPLGLLTDLYQLTMAAGYWASGISEPCTWFDAEEREHAAPAEAEAEDLLVPVVRRGRRVYDPPEIAAVRERALGQLAKLPSGVRRLEEPERYAVGLDRNLYEIKEKLIGELRARVAAEGGGEGVRSPEDTNETPRR